jgi:UDP-N-acetylglucosamine transferase subunit ALG13
VIFVTVGNATQPFPRLTTAVDQLVGGGLFESEPVFVQTGSDTAFRSRWCEHRPCGTLRNVLLARKRPVVMPRRKRYGEHVSDHQMQLARALSAQERIFPAYEADELPGAIAGASVAPELPPFSPPPIVGMVAMAVDALGSAGR